VTLEVGVSHVFVVINTSIENFLEVSEHEYHFPIAVDVKMIMLSMTHFRAADLAPPNHVNHLTRSSLRGILLQNSINRLIRFNIFVFLHLSHIFKWPWNTILTEDLAPRPSTILTTNLQMHP
jgi:hypothetical protein